LAIEGKAPFNFRLFNGPAGDPVLLLNGPLRVGYGWKNEKAIEGLVKKKASARYIVERAVKLRSVSFSQHCSLHGVRRWPGVNIGKAI
jgi:hypothetical protein